MQNALADQLAKAKGDLSAMVAQFSKRAQAALGKWQTNPVFDRLLSPLRDLGAKGNPAAAEDSAQDPIPDLGTQFLPCHPGWAREDWLPETQGIIRRLTLHWQQHADQPDDDDAYDDDYVPAESAWRFQLEMELANLGEVSMVGRLDAKDMRLLIRSERPLGASVCRHLIDLAGRTKAGGRRIHMSYDVGSEARAVRAAKVGIDRRA